MRHPTLFVEMLNTSLIREENTNKTRVYAVLQTKEMRKTIRTIIVIPRLALLITSRSDEVMVMHRFQTLFVHYYIYYD